MYTVRYSTNWDPSRKFKCTTAAREPLWVWLVYTTVLAERRSFCRGV